MYMDMGYHGGHENEKNVGENVLKRNWKLNIDWVCGFQTGHKINVK